MCVYIYIYISIYITDAPRDGFLLAGMHCRLPNGVGGFQQNARKSLLDQKQLFCNFGGVCIACTASEGCEWNPRDGVGGVSKPPGTNEKQ